MSDQVYLELLAEDKSSVAYRPRFASFTGSALAAILLQQIVYWWKKTDGKAFFKFREPSKHKLYQSGDSWCEELEWNAYEFDTALKVIGTKIVKGVSKTDMLATDMPIRKDGESDQEFYDRLKLAVSRCVVYWTDSNRITWYLLNEQLLGKFVSRIYLDKSYSLKYLKTAILGFTRQNRNLEDTSVSEITSETTAEREAPAKVSVPVVMADSPIMLPEMLATKHTPLREPQAQRSEIPPTPIAAAPLPQQKRSGYHFLIEAWRAGHPANAQPSPTSADMSLAIKAQKDGYTAEQVTALTEEKIAAGKTLIKFSWVIQDLPDYVMRQSKISRPAIQFPTYVPLPQAAPVTKAEIERLKAEVLAKMEQEQDAS